MTRYSIDNRVNELMCYICLDCFVPRNDDTYGRHCETFIKKIKQHKMTMAITNNGVMWFNRLHFSGLLRAGALAMTSARTVIASLRSNPENTEYQCVAKTCHWKVRSNPDNNK